MGRWYSWIPAIRDRAASEQFRPYLLTIILIAALAFPYLDGNEGDIDAAAKRVGDSGGKVLRGPNEVPGGNWVVHAADPQGAAFALHGPKK